MRDTPTAASTPPPSSQPAPASRHRWHITVPDEAPSLFKTKLRWAYPAYRAYELWAAADGQRMSAAMSFYGLVSLAPLLLLIVVALGWWLGQDQVQASLIAQVSELIGQQGADMLQGAIVATRAQSSGVFASIVALVTLVMGATGVFAELQSAIERLWIQGTQHSANGQWWRTASVRLRGVGYVMVFGFLLLVSLVISSVLSWVQTWADGYAGTTWLLSALNVVVSLAISTALFVGLMRMSTGPKPGLRHLVAGALIGALLFALGKQALAIYLRDAAVVSAYGAAGSLVVILFWIYFSSAVLLLAASCARVSAEMSDDYQPLAQPAAAPPTPAMSKPTAPFPPDSPLAPTVAAAEAASDKLRNALADLAQPEAPAPTLPAQRALSWSAVLLGFAAGFSLISSARARRLPAQLDQANAQLAAAQLAMSQLGQQQTALRRDLGRTQRQARRAAWWRNHTRDADRELHEAKGAWLTRLNLLLRALR